MGLKYRLNNLVRLIKSYKYCLLIILLAAYFAFQGLSNNYFWDDEATTAIFANNFLKFGTFTGWDGRNLFGYRNGLVLDNNLNVAFVFDSLLQCYMVILSFFIFGPSTWTARLPFVIIGLLSLLFFLMVLKEELQNSKFNIVALSLLAFSPSFLLYIRQARYYALTIFLPLFIYLYYKKYIRTNRKLFLIYVTIGAIALFYSSYLVCIALLGALTVIHLLFYSKKKQMKCLLIASASFILTTLPFVISVIFLNPSPYFKEYVFPPSNRPWILDKLTLLFWNFRELNSFAWFPWIVALGLVYFLVTRAESNKFVRIGKEWILLILSFIFFITILSPQPVRPKKIADVRYLVTLFPFLAALIAIFLFFIKEKSRLLFSGLFLILIFTNLLSINPLKPHIRFDLINYLTEIHNDYTTPYEAADQFLKECANKDDLVYIYPEYMNYPILFYAGNKIKLCGQLNKNTKLPIPKLRSLNAPLFIEEEIPDWIIMFGKHQKAINTMKYFSQKGARYALYKRLKIYWRDMTRPEILWHSFGPKKDFNPNNEGIYIFKKIIVDMPKKD